MTTKLDGIYARWFERRKSFVKVVHECLRTGYICKRSPFGLVIPQFMVEK